MRDALGIIARNVDAGAVHISWCSDYAKRVLANDTLHGSSEAKAMVRRPDGVTRRAQFSAVRERPIAEMGC